MTYIERDITDLFIKLNQVYSMIAITGARQSGKTTFLKHNSNNANYIMFDDPDAKQLFEQDIKKFEIQYLNKKLTILDELQYCQNAGKHLKYLFEKGHKIWITSSSSNILEKEILSYLVGRISIIKMYPLSYSEFKKFKDNINYNRLVWEHATYGGYPKVVTTNDSELKQIILSDLYETMVLKDIAFTFSINDIDSLKNLTKYLANTVSKQIAYDDISNKLNISFQTIKKYITALEKSNLIQVIKPKYKNKIKEIIKQPKIYFIDNGILNHIINNFNSDLNGDIFENYVMSELIKKGYTLKYWRTKTGHEIDCILNENIPVEIKLNSKKNPSKNLKNYINEYQPQNAYVVFYEGSEKTEEFQNCKIQYIQFDKFISKNLNII
jgi:uncharacterized protein